MTHFEELRDAILRLPKPPDSEGDGPDERVNHVLRRLEIFTHLVRDLLAALDRDHIDSGSVAQIALRELVRDTE